MIKLIRVKKWEYHLTVVKQTRFPAKYACIIEYEPMILNHFLLEIT